jgi:hypothetical protein
VAIATLKLGEVTDLQSAVEGLWAQGHREIGLEGEYSPTADAHTLLRVGPKMSGLALRAVGSGARLNGAGRTAHVVIIDNADVTISGLGIFGGDTTDPAMVARTYDGPAWRSAYEAMDGAGVLVTGTSNVELNNIAFTYNHSGMCGGALSNQGTSLVEVMNCLFVGNTAYHTGAAIDNLTPGASIVVHKTYFQNNASNRGSKCGGPHGQVTLFPYTKAVIRHCDFVGVGPAIDAAANADLQEYANKHDGRSTKATEPAGEGTMQGRLGHLKRLLAFDLRLLHHGLYPWVRR